VLPVLLVGIAATAVGGAKVLVYGLPNELEPEAIVIALLSCGGACGFAGYLRARRSCTAPFRRNVTATLTLLAAGVLSALSVAAIVAVSTVDAARDLSGVGPLLLLGGVFAAANLAWAGAGIAWMQRLLHRYAEKTGRAFDVVPVVLLLVAISLGMAAILATATL
jgi:hypothetical protein